MKAAPEAQRHLLDVQAIDTALQQLAHRRSTLPSLSALNSVGREISDLDDERIRAQVAVDDIDRDITRLERDTEQVRSRAEKDRSRLDAGSGPARELEALQHEITSLSRRQSELEDAELELMEQRDVAQNSVDQAVAKLEDARQRQGQLQIERDESLAAIAKEADEKLAARQPMIAELPDDLVGLYDKIREASGGIGAALLRSGRCGGCRIELSGG
ncbi:MAG TPA: hypothetical protein VH442_00065, partial [Micromonosporaceae bacterium]